MNFRFLFLIILPLTLFAHSVLADINSDVKRAQKALAAGDYEKAYTEYSRIEQKDNNPLAQFNLALFHDYGWGRPVDRVEACRWYEKAAEGDIPAAAHFFANCLLEGTHRQVDLKQAAHWYQRSADLGHHGSLCPLGELYMQGNGVTKNPAKALELCEGAAAQGSTPAMLRLSNWYLEEDGIRDAALARHWLGAAAQQQSAQAQFLLAIMVRDGQGGDSNPLAAREWFEAAAGQGYRDAYFPTAQLYFDAPADPQTGAWSAKDLAKTYLWLSAAAQGAVDPEQQARAKEMLQQVREVMPTTWAPDLDEKVAEHFKKFSVDSQ
jgi:TPR repeat protein